MKKIAGIFKRYIFREDLDLQSKWWHRLFKILFLLSILIIFAIVFSSDLSFDNGIKYKEVGSLSERITPEIKSLSNLLAPNESFGDSEYSPILNSETSTLHFILRDTYCSTELSDSVEKIKNERDIEAFYLRDDNGKRFPVSFDTFTRGIMDFDIKCVMVDAFTKYSPDGKENGKLYFLEVRKDYQDDYSIYKESPLDTFLNAAFNLSVNIVLIFSVIVGIPIVIMIIYYKVFIYIVYGRAKM